MPTSIQPIKEKTYHTLDGKTFVVKSVSAINVVIEFASGMRLFMTHEGWNDLRLDIEKTLGRPCNRF